MSWSNNSDNGLSNLLQGQLVAVNIIKWSLTMQKSKAHYVVVARFCLFYFPTFIGYICLTNVMMH